MAEPNIAEIVVTTHRLRRKKIADAVSNNNAIMHMLRRKGRVKTESGGRVIDCPVMYGENEQRQYYSGYDRINIAPQQVLTAAEFEWKQWAVPITVSGRELLLNSGKAKIASIIGSRMEHGEKSLANMIAEGLYSDGTADAGLQIGGLQSMFADAAGATVGGIDSSLWPWWEHARVDIAGGPTTANIVPNMLSLWQQCCRGSDKIDLIMADNTYGAAYELSLVAQQRFMSEKMAAAGFDNIMYKSAPVVTDGHYGGSAPVGMQFLNTSTIEFVMHEKRNNVAIPGPNRAIDQDAETVIIAGMGNLTVGNRARNGRLSTA